LLSGLVVGGLAGIILALPALADDAGKRNDDRTNERANERANDRANQGGNAYAYAWAWGRDRNEASEGLAGGLERVEERAERTGGRAIDVVTTPALDAAKRPARSEAPVPEPGSALVFAAGLLVARQAARKRR
jgi:hypothetical protein